MRALVPVTLGMLAIGCSCSGAPPRAIEPSPDVAAATDDRVAAASYEVHEWGLVLGTLDDRVLLSGPHADAPPMPVTKPVLYFHRRGHGALVVDVEARVLGGRVVEHWPSFGGDPGAVARWDDVLIQAGSCSGSRYPSLTEDPCTRVTDGCEAATLASVETTDSDCVHWPSLPDTDGPPDDDGPTMAWNHLFYRGEITSPPQLPLIVEPLPDGTLRITSRASAPIPGSIIRMRRANGVAGVTDAASIATAPATGASIVIGAPSGPLSLAAESLAGALREAGLTDPEIAAFRRAWDVPLFGAAPIATTTPMPTTVSTVPSVPRAATSLLYVLPVSSADALATLTFTPPPTVVRRAIVVWIDETFAR